MNKVKWHCHKCNKKHDEVFCSNSTEVFYLAKKFQDMYNTDDMDDYSHGVVDGIEFVLFLTERMEK